MRKRHILFVCRFVGWFSILFCSLVAYLSTSMALQCLQKQSLLDCFANMSIAYLSLFALLLAALFTMICFED